MDQHLKNYFMIKNGSRFWIVRSARQMRVISAWNARHICPISFRASFTNEARASMRVDTRDSAGAILLHSLVDDLKKMQTEFKKKSAHNLPNSAKSIKMCCVKKFLLILSITAPVREGGEKYFDARRLKWKSGQTRLTHTATDLKFNSIHTS